jgi:DNA adenine methylase
MQSFNDQANPPPTRPVLRYHGGKWKLAPWIISHFPKHQIYVEPFGGAGSVLLRKPRSFSEVYNDLDDEVVNLFQVMRDKCAAPELIRLVSMTPFSRQEYETAYQITTDPVERARRMIVRSFMGHGSTASNIDRKSGFRANFVNGDRALPALDWANLPPALNQVASRLVGVVIERRPALQVIDRYDSPDCLIYADPPYLHETRSAKRKGGQLYCSYAVEMMDSDHDALLKRLLDCRASVVVSGYRNDLYDKVLKTWRRNEYQHYADGARKRVEVIWINDAAASAMYRQSDMFSVPPVQSLLRTQESVT